MSNLIPFQFNATSIRVITTDDGKTLFVAKDVAEALGYANTASAITLHCKKAKTLQESKVCNTHTLHPQTKLIPESDVYRLAMKSELPSAEPFQDWLADEVIPSIRKTGGYQSQPVLPSFEEALKGVTVLADYLRLSNIGRVALVKPVVEQYGVHVALPDYVNDAPPSESSAGSSKPVSTASELLKQHDSTMSTVKFNKLLNQHGVIEQLSRKSSKGTKNYWSIADDYLEYGKNDTSTSNPLEVQIHWYIHKFAELLSLVSLSEKAA